MALVIGAFLIAFSDQEVIESLKYFFSYPWDFFSRSWDAISSSYWALVKGSLGSANAISSTLNRSAPLICAGLGVTLAFRAGLFNIGAQGQLIIGAICAGYVGFTWTCPPASTCWSRWSPAWSAARCGAGSSASSRRAPARTRSSPRSCSTTWRASVLLFALSHDAFQRPGSDNALSPPVDDSATFPRELGGFDVHTGVLLALLAGVAVWWLLDRSTWASSCGRSAPTPTPRAPPA